MSPEDEFEDEDMAAVGRALMETLRLNYPSWMPLQCPSEVVVDLLNKLYDARMALFMCAASCQGGHSGAGKAASEVLGIEFPVSMENLVAKAMAENFDPMELWPWSATAQVASKQAM